MNAVSGLLSAATAEAIPRTYNFARDIFERNDTRRNRVAYIDQSGSWTYQQLRQRAESFAHVLEALQVRPEERVLMCLLDSIDWPTVFLGTLYAGRVAVPVNTLMTEDDYRYMVEREYGASVPDLIEIAGITTFRRYERTCLERVIGEQASAVIATAGGIVANPDTYALLLRRTHAVWIKARPEAHMSRVMEQGDFRPMAQNREAMTDLVAILEARGADYARAQAALDTSGDTVEESFEKLRAIATRCMDGA